MSHSRNHSHISSCLKWTLFMFNFIFWVCALLLSAAGAYGMYFTAVERWDGEGSLEYAYIVITDLSGVLLALGAIIWLVSFAGCVGALRENLCLLRLYFWSVTIFLILELIIAIAFLVFPWKSREIVELILSERLIEDYRESENTKDLVDMLQMQVGCCGMTSEGYLDWNQNEYFNCSESNPSPERCGVPHSCCLSWSQGGNRDMMCGYGKQSLKEREASDVIHTRGCMSAIIQLLENNLYVAAGVIFAITLFQMYVTHQAKTLLDQIELQRARWY